MGRDGVLRARGPVFCGIRSGVDYGVVSAADDPALAEPFDAGDPAPKASCKAALMCEAGIEGDPDALLLGAVTRLTDQKGFDLLLSAVPTIVGLGCWLVLLGAGDPALELGFGRLAAAFPGRVPVRIGHDEPSPEERCVGEDGVGTGWSW